MTLNANFTVTVTVFSVIREEMGATLANGGGPSHALQRPRKTAEIQYLL
jgi:hypothetical protein